MSTSHTQEMWNEAWADMPKEDYPWAEEDMPAEVRSSIDMSGIKAIDHNTHHVVGCHCWLCAESRTSVKEYEDDDLPF